MKFIKGQVWIPLGNLLYIFDYLCIYINSMCYPYTVICHNYSYIIYPTMQSRCSGWSDLPQQDYSNPCKLFLRFSYSTTHPGLACNRPEAGRPELAMACVQDASPRTKRSDRCFIKFGWVGCLAILTRMDSVSGEIREYVFGTQSAHDTTSYNAYHSLIKSWWNIYGQ